MKHIYKLILIGVAIFSILLFIIYPSQFKYFIKKILNPTSLKISNTPINIDYIKQIGQFYSSEYCSEVYCSSKSIGTKKASVELAEFEENFTQYYNMVRDTLVSLKSLHGLEKGIRVFQNNDKYEVLRKNAFYKDMFDLINNKNRKSTLISIIDTPWDKRKDSKEYKAFKEFKLAFISENMIGNSDWVYIGRGCVFAGFDLESAAIKDTHINDILYIRNLEPVIFESVINPWFIPGKVAGYELFNASNRFSFSEIREVKIQCVKELSSEAKSQEIKLKALYATEDYLKQIFLPINNSLKDIVIEGDILKLKIESYLHDGVLEDIELREINSFIPDFIDNKDSVYNKRYSNLELKNKSFADFSTSLKNYFSTNTQDKRLINSELNNLRELIYN